MNNFTKRCVAAFASLAMAGTLCAAGAVTVSGVAWGSTGKFVPQASKNQGGKPGLNTPSQDAKPGKAPWELGTEASTKTGSITIYKWEDEVENGNQKKSTPVPGASFTVKKVTQIDGKDIDLTKYADWVKVANKIDGFNKGTTTGITTETTGTTKSTGTATDTVKGVAKFDNLKIGLYQVQETTVPKGFSAAESKPFYMTIPRIEKDKTTNAVVYNYAPFADPKNKNLEKIIKKEVNTEGAIGAGDEVKYTITSELTKMKGTETGATDLTATDFENYSIFDLAPANYFTYPTDISSVVKKIQLGVGTKAEAGDTELTPTTDYTVAKDANQIAATTNDVARDKITISFTEAGKGKLAAAANQNAGKVVKVFVDLAFTLADSAKIQSNTVENKAAFSSLSGKSQIVGVKTAKVEFVKFSIKKVSAKDTTKTLPGAKFKMFATQAAAETCSKAITAGSGVENACASANTHFGEKETAAKTDSTAGTTEGVTPSYSVIKGKTFYILETVAPAGYIRNPEPVKVENISTNTELPFQDVPDDSEHAWFNLLPKTGAAGVILFALAGVCFVGAGFMVYIHRRKKEEEQAKLRA